MKRIALASLLTLTSLGAISAPVYRCGNSYQQTPCAGAAIIATDDSRTASQWAEARAVAVDERRLGREMERDRLVSEARAPMAPASLGAPKPTLLVRPGVIATHRAKVKQRRYLAAEPAGEFIAVAPRSKAR